MPGRIRERRPKETLSLVHRNKLSCVQEKGHCSEGADSLQLRITLEGVETLLWMRPVGLALCYFGARVETGDQ